MHNNSNMCIIIPRMPRQTKKNCFFNDVMMMSSSFPQVEQTWFGLNRFGEEKKNRQKIMQFPMQTISFPSSNINPSFLTKKLHKNA